MRYFANSDGVCLACRSVFSSRLRLIGHLNDRRRQACRDKLCSGQFPKLPEEIVTRLDLADRGLLTAARKDGHTHVLSSFAAVRADGRRMGRSV